MTNREVELIAGETVISDRHAIFRNIISIQQKKRTISLREHRQQGKTNPCVAAVRESSHFITDGAF